MAANPSSRAWDRQRHAAARTAIIAAMTDSASDPACIGWRGTPPALADGHALARITAQHRAGYEVHDGVHGFNAQPAAPFLKRGIDPGERPAVGDFVEIAPGAPPKILRVLPRRGAFTRAAAGERYARQIIAANIDIVFVLTGLDHDFNAKRIERYLALTEGSGAQPVITLTKADKLESNACVDALAQLAARLPAETPIHAINAKDPISVAALNHYLSPGITAVLVGSSGAGKSTLTNTLLGEARMATAATRASDGRGRHTTSHRALLMLPSGACLIDTPGMRELKLTGEENLDVFADIDALVARCRFADCGHGNEPGCAVRAALDSGELDPERFRHYLKLRGEHDTQAAQIEERMRREETRSAPHKQRHFIRDRERR